MRSGDYGGPARLWVAVPVAVLVLIAGATVWRASSGPVIADGRTSGVAIETGAGERQIPPLGEADSAPAQPPRVDLKLLAIRTVGPLRMAVLDLRDGEVERIPSGSLGMSRDPIDGGVVMPDGAVAVWQGGVVTAFRSGADRPLFSYQPDNLIHLPEATPSVGAIPTADGQGLWVVQPGVGCCGAQLAGQADLLAFPSGELLETVALPPNAHAVAASAHGLVINTHRSIEREGAGWFAEEGSHRVLEVSRAGELRQLGPGQAIAASGPWTAILVCQQHEPRRGCELELTNPETGKRFSVSKPAEGEWAPIARPRRPTNLPRWDATAEDGRILVGLTVHENEKRPGRTLIVSVDPTSAATATLHQVDEPNVSAAWADRGHSLVIVGEADNLLARHLTLVNLKDGASFVYDDAIPAGHQVVGAR